MRTLQVRTRRAWGTVLVLSVVCAGALSGSSATGRRPAPRPASALSSPRSSGLARVPSNSFAPAPLLTSGSRQVKPDNHTPEPAGKLVFSSERDGNYEIYVMNPDGGGVTRLTNNLASDREPIWSPDATRIAFVSDRDGNPEIYVMSASGDAGGFSAPTRLTNNPADDDQPAWSPDGSRIVFRSSRDGNDEVYVMNADGSNQRNVSNFPADDYEPVWSPDGQRLAFTSTRDVNEEVYTMDATGGAQTNISNNSNGDDRHPSWAGNRIAFQSTRDGNEEIYIMNADGSGQTRLTNNPAVDQEPWLSADGTRIAFASNRDNAVAFEVYTMAANGTGQTRLTRNDDDNDFEVAIQQQPAAATSPATNTIQFSAATYTVSEGAGSMTITVTRTGDTSAAAAVDYATVNGTASDRSDYQTAIGTLRFAAGENSKTITVFITDDAFAEPDESFNVTLGPVTGASLGAQSFATVTITDNDTATSATNPIDTPEFFVRQHYLDFLNREPEPAGFNAWVSTLRNCPAGDTRCDRISVSSAFFRSAEFQIKGYYVIRFYLVAFGRLPTYREFVRDTQRINAPTDQGVIANQAAYASEFTQREDFLAAYNGSNDAYVNTLMGRYNLSAITTPDPANPNGTTKVTLTRADLINRLNAGTLNRGQVLRAIVDSDQVSQTEFNRGFVASQYFGYLRRDIDTAGFNDWLNYLNTHPGDFRTMVNGFMNSTEYRARFGQP